MLQKENVAQKAIQAALERDWGKAEKINSEILEQNPEDIPGLNRLSLAQVKLGKTKEAINTLRQVLKIDPSNPIAIKNLKRLKLTKKIKAATRKGPCTSDDLFLEEKGKTKIVTLSKPTTPEILGTLSVSEQLNFDAKETIIHVKKEKTYIGSLPDLLAFRLLILLKKGYRYETYVRRVEPKTISVFVKEIFRPKRFQGTPSFL